MRLQELIKEVKDENLRRVKISHPRHRTRNKRILVCVTLVCPNCSTKFMMGRSKYLHHKKVNNCNIYCSKNCSYLGRRKIKPQFSCVICKSKFTDNHYHNQRIVCSLSCNKKRLSAIGSCSKGKPLSVETRKKISSRLKGELSYLWKGGITPINSQIRSSLEYKLWRETVFKRDDYTCQGCLKRGCRLNADHIKPFAYFPELRLAIDNGRTLCVECHRKTPTWGNKKHE